MGQNRCIYGSAYGFQNNWTALVRGGTAHTLAQADTTPDVTDGTLWYSINSGATTITHFDLMTVNSGYGLLEGKYIKVLFTDANTTIQNNSQLVLAGSADVTFNANGYLGLIYHNSAWIETDRSGVVGEAVNLGARTVTVAGTNLALTVNDYDSYLIVTGTIAASLVTGISGGYVGQRLIIAQGSGGAQIMFPYGNNIYYHGTASFAISGINSDNGTNVIEVVKTADTTWSVIGKVAVS